MKNNVYVYLMYYLAIFNVCLAFSKFLLEMSKVAHAKGLKAGCVWVGPLPYILIHDTEDIKVNQNYQYKLTYTFI